MTPNIFPRRSLKARVTLFVLSVFLVCIWSLALYSRHILHEGVERLASEQQQSTVTYVAAQVNSELKDRISALELIAGAIDEQMIAQPEVLQEFLEQRFVLHSLFNAGTFVTRTDGIAIASTPSSIQRIGVNYLHRDHIATALKDGRAKIGEPAIGQVMGVPVVPIAVPIRDAAGRIIGAMAGITDLGKPSFLDRITENRYGKTGGYLLIAPQYRIVVTATDKSRIMQPLPPPGVNPQVDRYISGHEESSVFVNPRGETVLASTKYIPAAGWYVAVQLPTEEAFAPIHDMLQRLFFAAILLTLFAGGLTWWMLRRQLSPITDAIHRLAQRSNADLPPQPLPVSNRQDEIGQLFAGFNRLLETVSERDSALADTLDRLQKIASRVPGIVFEFRQRADGGFCLPYASEALREIYRVGPEEVRHDASSIFTNIHPDDRKRLAASIKASATDLSPWREEYRLQFPGEPDVWLQGNAMPQREADGGTLWHGFVSDITEHKVIEEKLIDSEAHLSTIIENEPECIKIVDAQGRLTRMNPAGLAMIEADSLQQVAGRPVLDVIAPEYRAAFADMHRRVLAGEAVELKFEVLGLKGGRRWLETHAVPMLDHGKVVQLAVTRDISERVLAEEKLHLAASVFTHAREGITITAADGTIIDVNDTFCSITGYSREKVLGQNPRILVSGRQGKEFYAAMWRDLVEKGHWYGEIWNRRKNGEVYAEMLTMSAVRDAHGRIAHYVALFSDITQIKDHQRQLEHIAHFDALTRLPNRVLLADRMHQAMTQAQRRGCRLAVAYLDLDGFKTINDHHGHDIGDQLLMAVASNMQHALRDGDTLARLGGDEFVAMLLDLAGPSTSVPMLNRLLAAASEPVQVGEISLQVSASVGVTFYPQEEEIDADQLLRQADQAMYQAKLAGKNRYHIFDAEQDRHMRGHHESTERIRRALNDGEFVLHYQPKVNMRTGTVVGAEALIRWQHPEDGLLPPAPFLPTVEDHPLAIDIGEWVIDAALRQIETWQTAGLHIPVSVNVGARQLQQADFVQRLRRILNRHPRVDPNDLELEVLETSALEDLDRISQVIADCREIGITFALDDFGTGYSSLTYLKRLPVALLKIDQSFVRDMLDDPDDMAILDGVIGLASAFRRMVIAEGVETVEHGTALLQLGCVFAQGFGIARPMPADALPDWSANWRTAPAWKNLHPVGSDNLPLLFASVEHRAAMTATREFLRRSDEQSPPNDYRKLHFSLWLKTEGFALHGSKPAFRAVFDLHEQEMPCRTNCASSGCKAGARKPLRDWANSKRLATPCRNNCRY